MSDQPMITFDRETFRGHNKRLRKIYENMKGRCYNLKNRDYKYYGGKGVVICDEWLENFNDFLYWAFTHGYKPSLSIDRIDSNLGYYPDNCRWITMEENRRRGLNKRLNNGLKLSDDDGDESWWLP